MLPIDDILPSLLDTVAAHPCTVLSAAPGAGKTTRVPLALLQSGRLHGKIVMLEPRRLAATRAARFMAHQLGETVGQTVGYRIRGEQRSGPQTRIEVVTEGVLTRLLQQDPGLDGISLLIFDEFHERSLQADLGLALARDSQLHLREDLKLLVMSATLDGMAIAQLLGNAPVIESSGRSHPVDLHYLGNNGQPIEQQIGMAVRRALREHTGDILVFLPGQAEIHRSMAWLTHDTSCHHIALHALYGDAGNEQQQAALQPDSEGRRKVILSTSVAETSLTIDGVCIVIDSGLVRTVRFDPQRGMSGLVTVPVSQATATQRAGRAGRQQPGHCYRLWSAERQTQLAQYPSPDMLHSDLTPLALECAAWGSSEQQLAFLDAPPASRLQPARQLLQQLGALDAQARITAHGREMQQLPVHPRLAHMLLQARQWDMGGIACDVAALLEERDLLRGERDADLLLRWHALQRNTGDRAARERVRQQAARLRQQLSIASAHTTDDSALGLMLALCYPDRIARRRDARGERWQLANGTGGRLLDSPALSREDWLAIADVDGEGRDVRIRLAAPLSLALIRQRLPSLYQHTTDTRWSPDDQAVQSRRLTRVGAIVVEDTPLPLPSSDEVVSALCEGIRSIGWHALPLPDSAVQWLSRVRWVRQHLQPDWPDVSADTLLATLEQWLGPYLNGASKISQLTGVAWHTACSQLLDYAQQQQLEQLAPSHLTVPTGSRIALDYSGEQPVLAVRLQELFGQATTPRIAHGQVPVLLHLLSPAKRPLAITQDLSSFWQNAWKDVRKDMRGQYPRHYWPDNPLDAEPTRRTKAADDRARKS